MGAAIRLGAVTVGWALLHSALASRPAKRAVARAVGERTREGVYRFAYNAQSVLTFGALLLYGSRLPSRSIYHVRGPAAIAMRAAQAAAIVHALAAARVVGIGRLSGISAFRSWALGRPVPPAPAAQGPEAERGSELTVAGPFVWSRHPLNLSPLPVFWLTPHLTTRRLGFNLVGTAYLVLGSVHEERRLRAAYGERYARYQASGVPFFLPRFLALGG